LKKIITVVGARPQFVKASAVSRALKAFPELSETIVHTGQHYDPNMSDVFFREMDIPRPAYNLEIHGAGHGAMTGRMLEKTEAVLVSEKPDLVLVYGDTNTTLAGALAARKLNIPVAHVEAGLRSFRMTMPEEVNRILTDRISDLLFCPTDNALANLKKEGFDHFPCHMYRSGDVMYDSALFYSRISGQTSSILQDLNLEGKDFVLCTIHRQENTDTLQHLQALIASLNQLSREIRVILPLHPRTRNILQQHHIRTDFEPIEPVGYFDILKLLKHCALVMTDSGGMQKESYFFGKYCLTLREETEWTELVDNGYNRLVGTDATAIREGFHHFFGKPFADTHRLYGDGNAAAAIVSILSGFLNPQ
jgi:UDP-GlcNAc3NAcA epimerase